MRNELAFDDSPEIDFLPPSFHEKRQRRQKAVWRRALLGMFLTLIVLGTLRQFQVRGERLAVRDRLRRQATALRTQLQDPNELQATIDHLERRANLMTRLRLRVAPTRLLAAVSQARPRFVSLSEFRMASERIERGRNESSGVISPPPDLSEDEPTISPEQQDLDRLDLESENFALVVHLTGIAPDDVTLSRYLIALEETRLFDDVKLLIADEYGYRDFALREFRLELRVRRPGRQADPHPIPHSDLHSDPPRPEMIDARNDAIAGRIPESRVAFREVLRTASAVPRVPRAMRASQARSSEKENRP